MWSEKRVENFHFMENDTVFQDIAIVEYIHDEKVF